LEKPVTWFIPRPLTPITATRIRSLGATFLTGASSAARAKRALPAAAGPDDGRTGPGAHRIVVLVGKSRLTAEAASRARADGWQLLTGGCLDLAEGSVPYLPLMDALHDLPIDTLSPLLARWLGGVAEEPSPQHSEDAARGRVYAAYLEVLRASSRNSPLALVVEDVHWADRGTRDLLSYLVRALTAPTTRARVLIILTCRSETSRADLRYAAGSANWPADPRSHGLMSHLWAELKLASS
jgi:hypothetical protein